MTMAVVDTLVTVPTKDVKALLKVFALAGWDALDLGQRVTTEEGPEAEAVVRVRIDASVLRRGRMAGGLDSPLVAA